MQCQHYQQRKLYRGRFGLSTVLSPILVIRIHDQEHTVSRPVILAMANQWQGPAHVAINFFCDKTTINSLID